MAETNGPHYVGTRTIRPDGVDKVTGRARFGADFSLPGQLIGRVLRSPHPHARIISIDTSKAEALPGVKAVVTRDDFADQPSEFIPAGEMMMNYKDVVRNVMAREKALYEGHAVAAVAATSVGVARRALKLIDVTYEVLPHVIDVVDAMQPGAPLLHDDLFTVGVEPEPDTPSNIAKRIEIKQGDVEAGFKKADVIVEREFKTAPVHQGYIEPHAALATVSEDGAHRALDHHPGPLHRARPLCAAARSGHRQGPGHRYRDRGRLRRQDRRLSRAAGHRAVPEGESGR